MNTNLYPKIIQVYEHEKLRIGDVRQGVVFDEKQWQLLLQTYEKKYPPFFRIIHRGVQFGSYVGLLSTPALTLEILPKADSTENTPAVWRHYLLDMLLVCREITPYAMPAAGQQWQHNHLLELWLHQFLEAVEQLLQQGLLKKYQPEEGSHTALRGKMLFSKNIRHNLVHQERFYTRTIRYDEAHPQQMMIRAALDQLEQLPCSMTVKDRARHLKVFFPECRYRSALPESPLHMCYTRQTLRYKPALELAHLILSHLSPSLRSGMKPALSMMFDMNRLYETYVYEQLLKAARSRGIRLQKQVSTRFWDKRSLRPDMILQLPDGQTIVLDTKWKLLPQGQPSEEDLKQMYIYTHYFQAERGVLLYPQVSDCQSFRNAYYQPAERKIFCEVHFVNVLDRQGRLNRQLGEELLTALTA